MVRIKTEWDKLYQEADKNPAANEIDYGGPAESPMRLRIPGWMLGTDTVQNSIAKFEAREMKAAMCALGFDVKKEQVRRWNAERPG